MISKINFKLGHLDTIFKRNAQVFFLL